MPPRRATSPYPQGSGNRVAVSGDIYDDLYNARNQSLHGNPVTGRNLRYRRTSEHLDLVSPAPLVFNVAVLSYLDGKVGDGPAMPERFRGGLLKYVAGSMRRRSRR